MRIVFSLFHANELKALQGNCQFIPPFSDIITKTGLVLNEETGSTTYKYYVL